MADRPLPRTAHAEDPGTAVGRDGPDADELALRVEHLQRALANSRRIGAATGILMARRGWDYEQSFDWLRRASQASNRKISDLAEEIVLTGTLQVVTGPGRSSGWAPGS